MMTSWYISLPVAVPRTRIDPEAEAASTPRMVKTMSPSRRSSLMRRQVSQRCTAGIRPAAYAARIGGSQCVGTVPAVSMDTTGIDAGDGPVSPWASSTRCPSTLATNASWSPVRPWTTVASASKSQARDGG